MNSALQCLAHSKELTDYFLSMVNDTAIRYLSDLTIP